MKRRDKELQIAEAILEDWAHTVDRYKMMKGPLRKAAYVAGQAALTAAHSGSRLAPFVTNRPDFAKSEQEYLDKLDDDSPYRTDTFLRRLATNQSPAFQNLARQNREFGRRWMSDKDRAAHDKYMRDNVRRVKKLRKSD